ncbi:hypothetical protein A3I46_03015 [Candidatus Kaiserbacteria bacterium RIFCSPLOWO2_02_FULL_54_13]|uniref:Prepilin-type N-terminal cleavage/methylation domain-containing protein n=1 Tax=Candidatus Kaiserbacteria bacterium RIFCSPHIGHO2_02_FULL_54_22 TaxID=1798495 RepID=A0A1F6DNC6_9BACT|nr:MAG: hypothetical protein UY89_C0003G0039 [Parcubacteria group bacterium GW2011_GWA1_54_9]KKW42293.1 MAG: hypothetical protein UY91_C0005G0015 [Parcubacteria group bacterium GW2011_GWB1_55_9]OGG62935.1 MAG: hypothetical protein A3C19_02360 [Candidatus Kaiserbacteria bacterium RIFCSPHIGHO2_02_FULL_54_22]OGG68014.1 MAG: hypothetical protein A3E99_01865 [Candidatus Kaiserbacteria bacterium RIFCSPHIGHO2_12_FULL_54_16]OGG83524.1 MAG: hypothetical protein A3I46_03015 [Candidatus Kaiserbacteria bac
MNRGFTLIEAVIYIGLFSLLMVGAITTVYELLQGSAATSAKTMVQDEGNFVLRKISWALSSAASFSIPDSRELVVIQQSGSTVDIKLEGAKVAIRESWAYFLPLTTENVAVSDLVFEEIPASGGAPAGVRATTTINGLDFAITKYLRK